MKAIGLGVLPGAVLFVLTANIAPCSSTSAVNVKAPISVALASAQAAQSKDGGP